MNDATKETLQSIVEGEDDRDLDWAIETYEAEFEKAKEAVVGESTDAEEMASKVALGAVRQEVESYGGMFGGDAEELPVLTLGSIRREANYFVTEGDGLVGLGIVNPPEDPAGVATFILDAADGVDLDHAQDVFSPLNTVRAWTSRMQTDQIDNKGGKPVYICNSTDETKLEIVDPDSVDDDDPIGDLPNDREAKREMIHEHFITEKDHATIDNLADHLTVTNENGFEAAFGADVKRFRGQVADVYSNEDSGFGIMTLLDDKYSSDPDSVPETLIGDEQRTPGLQVIMDPFHLTYGENSMLDVYGFIERTDDGQLRMKGFGIIPLVEYEREYGDSDGQSTENDHEEETI